MSIGRIVTRIVRRQVNGIINIISSLLPSGNYRITTYGKYRITADGKYRIRV